MLQLNRAIKRPPSSQQGAALVVALMFLIILTLLGLATMTGTTLEERMAGNSRDYNVALQAAEAALRDAEADLKGTGTTPGRALSVSSFPVDLIGNVTTPSGCQTTGGTATGLCIIGSETTQLYNSSSVSWSAGSSTSTAYGQFTGATSLSGVSSQPRYVLEFMQFADGRNKDRVSGASGNVDYYYVRITARGWGQSAQTQVILQEVFIIALPT